MKVVLFCGGLGTRLREYTGEIPKPMVKIGYRPILWHLMKYYAHFGHKDFVLCLGYKADVIKEFFLRYEEWISNDFTLSHGGRELSLENNDIEDWNITFVDTGLHANIGERLVAVRRYVEDEEIFLANYSDGLTNLDLNHMIGQLHDSDKVDDVYSWVEGAVGMPFGLVFGDVPEPKTVKNRIHWDVETEDLQALLDRGATLLRGPDDVIDWHVLADPEGNEFCAFRPRE